MNVVREEVIVKPGGLVEVRSPDLPEGAKAEVLVFVEEPETSERTLSSFIGTGKGCYKTPEEAHEILSRERDRWES